MIQSAQSLAAFITTRLQTHKTCRVYQDALDAVWSPAEHGRPDQASFIIRFALDHYWDVTVHSPGDYGLVADFIPRGLSSQRTHDFER